uniref:Mediator complex subunit 22 n=1 Tax=Romanomermis culicivorax TaxID=13658 RepID=A0A915L3R4_ROMCU
MDTRQPLKDNLTRIIDDLNIIFKQIVTIMTVPKEQRQATGRDSDIEKLFVLFRIKEQELEEGMKIGKKSFEHYPK